MSYIPVFRRFADEEERLRSFATWPLGLNQKPKEMAEAGFFYTEIGDRVVCFYCGGRMKDWGPNDLPWEEHARWFGQCPYVLVMKGEDYVENVQNGGYEEFEEECSQIEPEIKVNIIPSSIICKICMEEELNTCFTPCGHAVACAKCSLSVGVKCPICRKEFKKIIRLFL